MVPDIQPGDIVVSPTNGEERVVVDIADYREEEGEDDPRHIICVLRYKDDDPRRVTGEDDDDVHMFSENARDIEQVVGHIS